MTDTDQVTETLDGLLARAGEEVLAAIGIAVADISVVCAGAVATAGAIVGSSSDPQDQHPALSDAGRTGAEHSGRRPTASIDFWPATQIFLRLAPTATIYVDVYDGAEPILVIDTGTTEVQISPPTEQITPSDLALAEAFLAAAIEYRAAIEVLCKAGIARGECAPPGEGGPVGAW
jgi:hypothetical protein